MKKLSLYLLATFIFANFSIGQELIKVDETINERPIFYASFDNQKSTSELKSAYGLHTIIDGETSSRAIISTYEITDFNGTKLISIQPTYPINTSLDYVFMMNGEPIPYTAKSLQVESVSAEILNVYPNSKEIPANVLTFYIEFDKPMRPDKKAFHNIALVREDGTEIEDVWRHRAVWQKNNTVLALMIHPGRIKKGIVSTSELEQIFIPGEMIHLVLKSGLQTQNGTVIEGKPIKSYKVTEDLREKVNKKVELDLSPEYNSIQPLTITFNSQMDFGLVNKWINIKIGDDQISGTFISKDDFVWEFYPEEKWQSGKHEIVVNYRIGDPGHNNMFRLFEEETVKTFEKEAQNNKELRIRFTIK